MNRERYTPMSTQSHFKVGVFILLETHRRLFKGEFGKMPKPLADDCHNMRGYCLDAPDELPAGSMIFESFGPDEDDWIWAPRMTSREPQA